MPSITKEQLIEALTKEEIKRSAKRNLEALVDEWICNEIDDALGSDEIKKLLREEVEAQVKKLLPSMVKSFVNECNIVYG